jgi:hypothetical protein
MGHKPTKSGIKVKRPRESRHGRQSDPYEKAETSEKQTPIRFRHGLQPGDAPEQPPPEPAPNRAHCDEHCDKSKVAHHILSLSEIAACRISCLKVGEVAKSDHDAALPSGRLLGR